MPYIIGTYHPVDPYIAIPFPTPKNRTDLFLRYRTGTNSEPITALSCPSGYVGACQGKRRGSSSSNLLSLPEFCADLCLRIMWSLARISKQLPVPSTFVLLEIQSMQYPEISQRNDIATCHPRSDCLESTLRHTHDFEEYFSDETILCQSISLSARCASQSLLCLPCPFTSRSSYNITTHYTTHLLFSTDDVFESRWRRRNSRGRGTGRVSFEFLLSSVICQ